MSVTRLSPAARGEIAHATADRLEEHAKRYKRMGFYADQFRALGDSVDRGFGRTGAWRKARAANAIALRSGDELVDYWLTRLHDGLSAEAMLKLNQPARAAEATSLLDALFPTHTLAVLVGLSVDREAKEVSKLIQVATHGDVAARLKELGVGDFVARLVKAHAAVDALLKERPELRNSGTPSGTATNASEAFDGLWKRFEGYLADSLGAGTDDEDEVVATVRGPFDEATRELARLDKAAATRATKPTKKPEGDTAGGDLPAKGADPSATG